VVTDPAGGLVSVDNVSFATASDIKNRKKGDAIRVSIRPERLGFASEQRKDNVLDCVIENITFLGSVVRIQVKIGDARFNMDTFNNPFLELPKIGAKEQVTCSREAVLVLDE
jgi:putative spermidine/putrescine transport system ATP-binding protein